MKLLSQIPAGELTGKTILMRADFNVPLKDGLVSDDTRIRETIPTIEKLLEHNAGIVLCSHLGRPDAEPNPKYSLKAVAEHLEKLLGKTIRFLPNTLDQKNVQPGEIVLLENTRYFAGEEANDSQFAAELARECDFFINDAFGTAHRAHASTEGVAKILPHAAGLLLEREISVLTEVLENPERPLVIIVGGAKMKTKIGVLDRFVEIADTIIVGGGIANTFLAQKGLEVGGSLMEEKEFERARAISEKAAKNLCTLMLPEDVTVAETHENPTNVKTVAVGEIEKTDKIFDIGPKSAEKYANKISKAAMLVWNGPVGIFEIPEFSAGTKALAVTAAEMNGKSILGGGDTLDAVAKNGFNKSNFFHLSTGGGAMLEFLEGKTLPGVAALS
jgi:phosphoglycerate kinase